jgi:type II secretory pathway component PulK
VTGKETRYGGGLTPNGNAAGMVMIAALVVMAVSAAAALSFSRETHGEIQRAEHFRDRIAARQSARSAAHRALMQIHGDRDLSVDHAGESWGRFSEKYAGGKPGEPGFGEILPGRPFPREGRVSCRITDESGKWNVNGRVDGDGEFSAFGAAEIRRLFDAWGLDPALADPLLDRLNPDARPRPAGGEDEPGGARGPPDRCINGRVQSIGQLSMITGWPAVRAALKKKGKAPEDFLTVYSKGKININTAPREVLRCLDADIDEAVAARIVDGREETPFETIADLLRIHGVDSDLYERVRHRITVNSGWYRVDAAADIQGARASLTAVVQRDENGRCRWVYWREK